MQNKRYIAYGISGAAFLIFGIFLISVLTHATWISGYDRFGNELLRHGFTKQRIDVVAFWTNIGGVTFITWLTIIAVAVFILAKHYTIGIWFGLTVLIGAAVISSILKHTIQRPRPAYKLIPEGGYSFPSGHSSGSTIFYGMLLVCLLLFIRKQWIRWTILLGGIILILLIMASRVYLGVHYFSDITAGFLFGIGIVILSSSLLHWFREKKPHFFKSS